MKEFDKLVEIFKILRGPNGCDWDKAQTIYSVRGHVLEEAYEVVDSIDRENWEDLKEELGDLLAQIVFISQMASEDGIFSISDVINEISDKLIRRHPHVFGDKKVSGVDEILHNWEAIKDSEKKNKEKGIFGSIPKGLPALMKSAKVLKKSKRKKLWNESESEVVENIKSVICGKENPDKDGIVNTLWGLVKLSVLKGIDLEAELNRITDEFIKDRDR